MPGSDEVRSMVGDYEDNRAIDYFEDEDDLEPADAAFFRGYVAA